MFKKRKNLFQNRLFYIFDQKINLVLFKTEKDSKMLFVGIEGGATHSTGVVVNEKEYFHK